MLKILLLLLLCLFRESCHTHDYGYSSHTSCCTLSLRADWDRCEKKHALDPKYFVQPQISYRNSHNITTTFQITLWWAGGNSDKGGARWKVRAFGSIDHVKMSCTNYANFVFLSLYLHEKNAWNNGSPLSCTENLVAGPKSMWIIRREKL